MNHKPIAILKKISKKINDITIFTINELQVDEGDIITIEGASGSGKTTLLNILGMNDKYTSGSYVFGGNEVDKLSNKEKVMIKRKQISFLFQDFGLVEEETIDFNLEIGLKYSNLNKKMKKDLKLEVLNKVNLSKTLNTSIKSLSGGEKQRVALARIMLKPSILILADEPTGSLDPINREIIATILKKQSEEGKAVIIVTHDKYIANLGNKSLRL